VPDLPARQGGVVRRRSRDAGRRATSGEEQQGRPMACTRMEHRRSSNHAVTVGRARQTRVTSRANRATGRARSSARVRRGRRMGTPPPGEPRRARPRLRREELHHRPDARRPLLPTRNRQEAT
jgi:hypothetical protein